MSRRDQPPPPPEPWEGYEVWRHVPELAELPPAEATEAYRRIRRRVLSRDGVWGFQFTASVVSAVVILTLTTGLSRMFWLGLPSLIEGVALASAMLVAVVALSVLLIRVERAIRVRMLRRLARIELGTHCPRCDYDLRMTADRAGPRHARCPECGESIPPRERAYAVPRDG